MYLGVCLCVLCVCVCAVCVCALCVCAVCVYVCCVCLYIYMCVCAVYSKLSLHCWQLFKKTYIKKLRSIYNSGKINCYT